MSHVFSLLLLLVSLVSGVSARAFPLYEGAVPPLNDFGQSRSVSPVFWPAERFYVDGNATVDGAGGYFRDFNDEIDDVFVAIVTLSGPDDFPDSNDLSTSDLLATSVVSVGPEAGDYLADFDLELAGGWYMIVIGVNAFGAGTDSRGLAIDFVDATPDQPTHSLRQDGPTILTSDSVPRFLVTSVPEPGLRLSSAASFLAILALAGRRRRETKR